MDKTTLSKVDKKKNQDTSSQQSEEVTKTETVIEEIAKPGKSMKDGIPNEINMDSRMTTDDVTRAGGFGARDDIGCFLPGAMDSTDFEASLRGARDFEEPQQEILRPGLGWTGPTVSDKNPLPSEM